MYLRFGVGQHHFLEVAAVVGRCGLDYLLDVALGLRRGIEDAFGGGLAAEIFDGVADKLGDGVVVGVFAGGVGDFAVAERVVVADVGADVDGAAHAAVVVVAAGIFTVDALKDGLLQEVREEECGDVEGAVLPEFVAEVEDVDGEDLLQHILHKPVVAFGSGEAGTDGQFGVAVADEAHYVAGGEAAVIGEGQYQFIVDLVIVVVLAAREEPDIVLVLVNERVDAAVGDVPQVADGLRVADNEVAAVVVCRDYAHRGYSSAGVASVSAGAEAGAGSSFGASAAS